MKYILLIFFPFLLFSCAGEQKEAKTDVFAIRNLGQLATCEYTIGKIIRSKDNKEWYKFGDRNILMSCKAKVKAGIDFAKIKEKSILIDGTDIQITLPKSEILSLTMDQDQIKTEMVDVNGFRQSFSQEEKNQILVLGEKSIRGNLYQTSILHDAQKNAAQFVRDFYKDLGFKNVLILIDEAHAEEFKAN